MYQFKSRVRYSEIGQDDYLTIPSILNYFQDCTTFQSEDVGCGLEWLRKHNRCWVISSWEVQIKRRPRMGENIVIGTIPYDIKGMFGMRNFYIKDTDGNDLVIANTLWTYMDTVKMRPAKVSEDVIRAYQVGEQIAGEWQGRKIAIPSEGQKQPSFTVGRSLLDTNGHVNNEKYVELAIEFLPDAFTVKGLRVEYKRSAIHGDVMIPVVYLSQNVVIVVLQNEDGLPYAVMEFAG